MIRPRLSRQTLDRDRSLIGKIRYSDPQDVTPSPDFDSSTNESGQVSAATAQLIASPGQETTDIDG
jgi:hypothetical protein